MARKKFEEGFKENAIEYCQIHSDKTIKACAQELGIGYSTLRRWIAQNAEEQAEKVNEESVVDVSENADDMVLEVDSVTEPVSEETVEVMVAEEKSVNEVVESVQVANEDVAKEATLEVVPNEVVDEALEETYSGEDVDVLIEAVQEDLDDEFEWVSKRDQVKNQLGGFIETAGNGVSDAVQLISLYKKRHELKKVQKKLQKEKEKRMKQ